MHAQTHTLPPALRRVRERDLDEAIRDLEGAIGDTLLCECDCPGPHPAEHLIASAERVLRLLEELR